MSDSSVGRAEEENVRSLLDQLDYLIDELKAQRRFLGQLPTEMLEAVPYPGALSIRSRYAKLLERELGENRNAVALASGSVQSNPGDHRAGIEGMSTVQIVDQLIDTRSEIVECMKAIRFSNWIANIPISDVCATLMSWAYKMALEDADDLRAITLMFSEQQIVFRKGD